MSEFDEISGFDDNELTGHESINFATATKLERTGSTCDAFVTRLQRRRVFIKRLKEELRDSPLHRAALDKEYDLGVNLRHPSLPDYREFHGDYIVMDFVDGLTIEEMIRRNDPWLHDRKNVCRMLSQLIDVVEYLHQHNVLHCDIKSDNVMLTSIQRNLMLIDLDKAYTDWLNDTPGNPALYDVPSHQSDIDFHGIGKLVERLSEKLSRFPRRSFYRFKNLCFKPDVTPNELIKALQSSSTRRLRQLYIPAALILLFISSLLFIFRSGYSEISTSTPVKDTREATEGGTETSQPQQPQTTARPNELTELSEVRKTQLPSTPEAKNQKTDENSKAERNGPNKKYHEVIDRESDKYIKRLKLELQQMLNSIDDTTLSRDKMMERIDTMLDKESETRSAVLAHLCSLFPELDKFHVSVLMIQSESWRSYQQLSDATLKKYSDASLRRK